MGTYHVTLNGMTAAEETAWANAMLQHGHGINVAASPAFKAPIAGPSTTMPTALPPSTTPNPPAIDGLTWQRADNGNGYKAMDPVLREGRYPVAWLWNNDARPMADGTPGAWIVKARIMGHWLPISRRAELIAQFGGTQPAAFPTTRGRRR